MKILSIKDLNRTHALKVGIVILIIVLLYKLSCSCMKKEGFAVTNEDNILRAKMNITKIINEKLEEDVIEKDLLDYFLLIKELDNLNKYL